MPSVLKKILVPFDFSDSSRQALATAIDLSSRFGSELLILTVIERHPESEALKSMVLPEDIESRLTQKIQELALALIPQAERSKIRCQAIVRRGKAPVEILLAAEQEQPDLILMGTKGVTGVKRILLGSVAERVVRQAVATVWVCRESSHKLPKKILVPVDFSEYSRQVLEKGVQWARELKSELFVLHVADLRYLYALDPLGLEAGPTWEAKVKKEAEDELQKWAKNFDFPAKLQVRVGAPTSQILEAVQDDAIDLVLLSTHGRTGLKLLLMGSVAEQVVRYSPCSVMTVCPPAIASAKPRLFEGEKELEDYVRSFRD